MFLENPKEHIYNNYNNWACELREDTKLEYKTHLHFYILEINNQKRKFWSKNHLQCHKKSDTRINLTKYV